MLVDDHAAAALLCLSVDTLRKDRRTTHLIPCVRIGRAVRYSPSRLAEFVARAGE